MRISDWSSDVCSSDLAVSAEAVKSHIKALIAAEDPKKILSDDTLVDLLRAKGFDIARRTVAKYRESIGIGSSVQRRRQKAVGSRAACGASQLSGVTSPCRPRYFSSQGAERQAPTPHPKQPGSPHNHWFRFFARPWVAASFTPRPAP